MGENSKPPSMTQAMERSESEGPPHQERTARESPTTKSRRKTAEDSLPGAFSGGRPTIRLSSRWALPRCLALGVPMIPPRSRAAEDGPGEHDPEGRRLHREQDGRGGPRGRQVEAPREGEEGHRPAGPCPTAPPGGGRGTIRVCRKPATAGGG